MACDFFDGFPYQVTRVSPSFYHLIVLPWELPIGHLKEIVRWQATSNKLPSCLVLGPRECIYFEPDGSEMASPQIPRGGAQITGFLMPCCPIPASDETRQRIEALVKWAAPRDEDILGDLTKGGRRATPEDFYRLEGNRNGIPNGLVRCPTCGEYRGECLDPSPRFAGWVMRVHCICENDSLCARCGKPLDDRKLNANYFRNGEIIHTPGFCGFRHRCEEPAPQQLPVAAPAEREGRSL